MSPESRKTIQWVLLAAIVVAGIRAGLIFYQRHEDAVAAERKKAQEVGYSNPDYYVSPKKLYPYDIKSAKQLGQQPIWVREGYHSTYYPYDAAKKHVDFAHSAGLLGPIEKLSVTDVIVATPPGAGEKHQVLAVFQKADKSYAVPIGYESEGQFQIYSDDMFFIEDPHDLYKHWPADVWQSVERHEVKPGMNDLQVDFAIGMGIPDRGGSQNERTVRYSNGGKPLVVIYHGDKVAEVRPGTPES
jgi:hypothetical protein